MCLILPAFSSPELKAFPLHLRHCRSSGSAPSLPNLPRAGKSCLLSSVLSAASIASAHNPAQPRPARLCALFRSAIAPLHKPPQTRRRSHQPCCVVLLSAPQYPWRKDPHLPSQPPSSATCRARTGLPPMPFVSGFRICSRRRETRPQIPQAKENSPASAYSVLDPHLPLDGCAGVYSYTTVRKS